jgi:hypothetical protein
LPGAHGVQDMSVGNPLDAAPVAQKAASFWSRLGELIRIFLPRQLQEIWNKGLLLFAVYLLLALVAFPLILVLLAAFWLILAEQSNIRIFQELRGSYVEFFHRGFSIDELVAKRAQEQNSRLDYLQVINFKIDRGSPLTVATSHTITLRLDRGQHMELQLNHVSLDPIKNGNCTLSPAQTPPLETKLVDVFIGKEKFLDCPMTHTQSGGCTAKLDREKWEKFNSEFVGQKRQVNADLRFERSQEVKNLCATLSLEGSLLIFKDIVELPAVVGK